GSRRDGRRVARGADGNSGRGRGGRDLELETHRARGRAPARIPSPLRRRRVTPELARELRAGIGYDAHRLTRGLPLVLGGGFLAPDRGPEAHSDGDVLAHAIGDALLGTVALGDLGSHFPDSDPRWRGASSLALLEAIAGMLRERGARIVNVDATVIAEEP